MAKTLTERLHKTLKSISAHVARGGSHTSQRGFELIDRYNDLKDELNDKNQTAWHAYCREVGADPSHDAYDLFA